MFFEYRANAAFEHQDSLSHKPMCTVKECIGDDTGNSFLKLCRETPPAPTFYINILYRQSPNLSQGCYCPCNLDMPAQVESKRQN